MLKQNHKFHYLIENHLILAVFIGLAYLNGILNFQHLYPSAKELYISLISSIIITVGILLDGVVITFCYNYITKDHRAFISWSLFGWFYLFLLILVQPFINNIMYPDGLVFPLASILLVMILCFIIINMCSKTVFIWVLAFFLLIGGILELLTQLGHLFNLTYLYNVLLLPIGLNERPVGNVGQPNQATYIYAMAIVALAYLQHRFRKYNQNSLYKQVFGFLSYFLVVYLAIGFGISGSRGGVILGFVGTCLFWLITEVENKKDRVYYVILYSLATSIGFYIGNQLLEIYNSNTRTIIDKVTHGVLPYRQYQLEQAWLIFKDSPLTGIGFKNFALGGLQHAEQLPWFAFSDHSHMIVSQIASELGVIGLLSLIPVIYIIGKNIRLSYTAQDGLAITLVMLTLLYSFSEYPLWYFIYLIMFGIFLALLDIKISVDFVHSTIAVIISTVLLLIGSIYYQTKYRDYSEVAYRIIAQKDPVKDFELFKSLPPVFGFSDFYELYAFSTVPTTLQNRQEKMEIGKRVIASYPTTPILIKQANLYVDLDYQNDALTLYKAGCLYDFAIHCNEIEESLKKMREAFPNKYTVLYESFEKWRKDNPKKTDLVK